MILVDSNVIIDILTDDPLWFSWSSEQILRHADERLSINPIIYAELCAGFKKSVDLETQLADWNLHHLPLPYEAAFPASRAFLKYRRKGGLRSSPLPDFFIGAHAQSERLSLLTRDPTRYRTYFPTVQLIAP